MVGRKLLIMKTELFKEASRKTKRNALKDIAKSKQRLKTTKNHIKTAIETVLFYNSEIQMQAVRFKNNLSNINRF